MRQFIRGCAIRALGALVATTLASVALADETCNSPYTTRLIKGQEDYVHVWTLGVQGLGDGSDKLVTVDVNPKSKRYGKVVHTLSVGGRGEAHHMGFTDDRKYLWAGGLDDSRIFVFDVGSNVHFSHYFDQFLFERITQSAAGPENLDCQSRPRFFNGNTMKFLEFS